MLIKKLTMVAGPGPTSNPLTLELSAVTIFVGPNNSGKSRALQEIETWTRSPTQTGGLIITSVEFEPWSQQAIESAIGAIQVQPGPNESLNPDHILVSKLNPQSNSMYRGQIHKPSLLDEAQRPNRETRYRYAQFLSLLTLKLDGANRLALTTHQPAGDLQRDPPNHLAQLFVDNLARGKLRRIVYEAFGKYLVIDPTGIGRLRMRLSPREPVDEQEEKGWHSVAQAFHAQAFPIEEASDGVKAFVGILSIIVAGEPRITLIDEPEAFLHPALGARLGKEVTKAAGATDQNLFISTHSASFLMGCIQAGADVNIVRLTYDYESATARLLSREKLTPLMRNPLLRSVGMLNALFYNAVVVTEGDADRAFYQEINERLVTAGDARGIAGCLFLNAQNKQTIWEIVRPLRELGIPAVGIVDIDVLKEGGSVWKKPLDGAFIPLLSHDGLGVERAALYEAFKRTEKDMKREGGIQLLAKEEQEACTNLFDKLASYGIFVVPNGELESWLSSLDVGRGKSTWLVNVFEKMGADPGRPEYMQPGPGDVWDFLGKIREWVRNPKRKGIPD